jgi:hypothetical protein
MNANDLVPLSELHEFLLRDHSRLRIVQLVKAKTITAPLKIGNRLAWVKSEHEAYRARLLEAAKARRAA